MTDALEEIAVVALDARGQGLRADGFAVAAALPGERVRVKREGGRAELVEILTASPERARPICAYFGRCGGCAAQHMSEKLYRSWRGQALAEALASEKLDLAIAEEIDAHGEGRRRATFHARFPHGAPDEVGFMRARSHDIVAIDACPLFSPGMAGAVAAARALAGDLRGLGKPLDISVTATAGGLDVDIRGSGPLGPVEQRKLVRRAETLDLARLSNHGEIIVERRAPAIPLGEGWLVPPPGDFLQATAAGERILSEMAEAALGSAKRVADLFCGAGAFALRLARRREVYAADSNAAAIAALKHAAAATPNLRAIGAETRDLFRRPMRPDELKAFDGALFDPPRAGAEAQARELAASAVPLVAAISCNGASFARDARILIDGGFAAELVTPLDQFRFSPHVELFAVFRRPRARKRARSIFSG